MWNTIKKHIGKHYVFRLDNILMSGIFCGIGEINNNYGMVFINTKYGTNKEEDIISFSSCSCLLIHPLRIKCTLHSDLLNLRRSCRKLFRKNKYTNISENIYWPPFEIKEIN